MDKITKSAQYGLKVKIAQDCLLALVFTTL